MSIAHRKHARLSWQDVRSWGDGNRWELIGGDPFLMSPAPSSRHQAVVTDLARALAQQLPGCRTLVAPIDVKLSDHDVVQPDVVVVCDPSQIRATHLEGSPDLAVEVLSPSTERHDRVRKLRLYARNGIDEYWLVRPYPAMVEVLRLAGDHYQIAGVYTDTETLFSPSFSPLAIDLATVFTLPLRADEHIDEIRESAPPYEASSPRVADEGFADF